MAATTSAKPVLGVSTRILSRTRPSSTTAARILVPPRSIPRMLTLRQPRISLPFFEAGHCAYLRRDGAFLVGLYHQHRDAARGRADDLPRAGVRCFVEHDAEEVETGKRIAARHYVVLADTAGEDYRVEPAHGGRVRADELADAVGEKRQRELGVVVAGGGRCAHVTHVVRHPGHTGKSRAAVEQRVELFDGKAFTQQVKQQARIDVAAASAHQQALKRREAHAGIDRHAMLDGGAAGAVTEVE